MKRRTFILAVALVLLLGGTLFAAGSSESASSKSTEGQTIVFQTFLDPAGKSPREKAWNQIIANFTAKTGITVKTNILPWEQIDPQLILSVQSGNPPDVSFVRDKAFLSDMKANSLLSLEKYINRDFDQATRDDYVLWNRDGMYKGQKYVIHMHYTPVGLYLRKDLMEQAGLKAPTTWDEFAQVGKALSKGDVEGYLFAVSPAQPAALDYLQPMIEGRGGKILNDDGTAAFAGDAGVKTFQFLKDLVYKYGASPKSTATAKYDEVTDAFSSGRVGMIIEGAHRYNRIVDALGADKVMLARIPGPTAEKSSPTSVSGWTLGIPRNSAHPDAAWDFIKFSTNPQSQLIYTQVGGQLPVRASVLKEPYFSSSAGAVTAWFVKYMNDNGTLAISPPTYQQLSELISVALQKTLSDPNSNVRQILTDTAKQYDAVVKNQ